MRELRKHVNKRRHAYVKQQRLQWKRLVQRHQIVSLGYLCFADTFDTSSIINNFINEYKEVFCFTFVKRKTWRWEVAHGQCPLTRTKGGKVVRARAIPTGQRSFTRGLSGSEANAHEYGDPPIKGRKKRDDGGRAERKKTEQHASGGTKREREPEKSW